MTDQTPRKALKRGPVIAGAGCLFGLAPLLLSILFALFGNGIGTVLHWYTIYTAPVGLVVVIVGVILWVNESSKPPIAVNGVASTGSEMKLLSPELANAVGKKYVIGAIGAAVLSFVEIAIKWPLYENIAIGDLLLLGGGVWIFILVRKLTTTRHFEPLRLAQFVVSIAVLVLYGSEIATLIVALLLRITAADFGMAIDAMAIGSGIVSLIAVGAAIVSLRYAAKIRKLAV